MYLAYQCNINKVVLITIPKVINISFIFILFNFSFHFIAIDAFCIGRSPTNTLLNSPFYNNIADPYCTNYYTCINGIQGTGFCPNSGFLDYSTFSCVTTRPNDQNCRIGKSFCCGQNLYPLIIQKKNKAFILRIFLKVLTLQLPTILYFTSL